MADGKVVIETDLDSSGIEKGLSKMAGLTKTGLKAATAAVGAATTVIAGAGVAAIKVGSDFESGMSKVAAISGATGKELDALTEKAKEMGAKTKFSASESAAAFEYMAMAGWKTEDMLGGIEGIMNLAAASGEDLATTSDIVTDALTAFGLQASDSAHFADVLAKASSSSNTNVGMMGDTFKYVAPLAGAMGYTIEDTAVAIGVMANSGIKASEAGTSLRAMFTRLAKPPKDAAAAMDALGISITNTDGSMKPLSEVIGILREKFAGLSEEQKIQYASSMAGQEAMSGLLAIVNASETDFQALTDSINNADGAAQEMAETMQNNLKGDLEELSGGLETLGLSIYENMVDTLRDAAKEGINYVEQLTEAFNSGGLQGVVSQAGDIFADIVTKAAEQAPKAVNAGVKMVQSFVEGIIDNRGRLAAAALDIAKTLADGLVKLLPSQLKRPVKTAIDAIAKLFQGNNLKSAVKSAETIFKNFGRAVSNITTAIIPPFTTVISGAMWAIDKLSTVIVASAVAFGEYQIVKKVTGFLTAYRSVLATLTAMEKANALQLAAATGALSVKEMVVGLLSHKITIATAKTALWNAVMTASPIGILTVAIGAFVAGLVGVIATTKDLVTQTEIENQKLAEEAQAIRDTQAARQESVNGVVTEYGYLQTLWQELQKNVDENGRVKESYRERAAFITGELSDALGIEMELVGDQITNYGELCTSIDQLIEKKKAEAIVNAYQESYTEALKGQADAQSTLAKKYQESQNAQSRLSEAQAAYNEFLKSGNVAGREGAARQAELLTAIAEAEKGVESSSKAYQDAKTKADEYNTTIANVEALQGAAAASSDNLTAEVLKTVNGFKNARFATDQELIQQRDNMFSRYQEMEAAAKEGGSGITQAAVTEAQAMYYLSEAEYAKMAGMAEVEIQSWVDKANEVLGASNTPEVAQQKAAETHEAYSTELANSSPEVTQAAETLPESANQALESADTTTAATGMGAETGDAAAASYAAQGEKVAAAASTVPESANSGMASSDVTSVPTSMGEEAGQALTDALNRFCDMVSQAATNLTDAGNSGIQNADMSTTSTNAATNAITAMITTFDGGLVQVQEAASRLGNGISQGFQNAGVGLAAAGMAGQAVSAMVTAVNGYIGPMTAAGQSLGNAVSSGIRSANVSGAAIIVASGACAALISAVNSRAGSARLSGVNLGNAVGTGIRSSSMIAVAASQASQMVQTFTRAIQAGVSAALSAGRNLATAVANGMRAANVSSTAQTEGKKIADGFCKGINNGKSAANTAGNGLAKSAASALENYGLYGSGHDTGENFASGFANGISANAYRAVAQASAMARAAAQAANAALGIHSPSRVGHWIGRMFDEGTAGGILDNTDLVEDAGTKVANALIEKMDVQAAYEKIRAAIQVESQKLGVMLTSKVQYVNSAEPETGKVVNQTININQPVSSPVETARAIRQQEIYGLAGA